MPTLCMIFAALFWGGNYIFIKIALQEVNPITFLFFSFLHRFSLFLASNGHFSA